MPQNLIWVCTVCLCPAKRKPGLDCDVPRSTPYGVYISQLIRFARASSYVADFNTRNKLLTQNILNKAIGIINFGKHFQNFIDDTMI